MYTYPVDFLVLDDIGLAAFDDGGRPEADGGLLDADEGGLVLVAETGLALADAVLPRDEGGRLFCARLVEEIEEGCQIVNKDWQISKLKYIWIRAILEFSNCQTF